MSRGVQLPHQRAIAHPPEEVSDGSWVEGLEGRNMKRHSRARLLLLLLRLLLLAKRERERERAREREREREGGRKREREKIEKNE